MRKPFYSLALVVGLIAGGFAVPVISHAATKQPAVLVPRKLDGVWVPKGQENLWPIAVMIDNHTSARPQSGLQAASIVYETLAEGGIPRFMAIFAQRTMPEIGPVRSTRPYFVRFAAEINAALAHAGGSPDGLNLLKNLRMQSVFGVGGAFAKYFYRAHVGGVHGLYTTGAKLAAALVQARTNRLTPMYKNWQYVDSPKLAQRPTGKHGAIIDLGYGRSYDVEYRYDRASNTYFRFTGYKPQIDRTTKKQVVVRNVIIMNTSKEKVLDKKGRLDIKVTGKDSGYLLKDGTVIPITWTKKNDRARTIFTTKDGAAVQLDRGNTWVTIVPKGHTYKVY